MKATYNYTRWTWLDAILGKYPTLGELYNQRYALLAAVGVLLVISYLVYGTVKTNWLTFAAERTLRFALWTTFSWVAWRINFAKVDLSANHMGPWLISAAVILGAAIIVG